MNQRRAKELRKLATSMSAALEAKTGTPIDKKRLTVTCEGDRTLRHAKNTWRAIYQRLKADFKQLRITA